MPYNLDLVVVFPETGAAHSLRNIIAVVEKNRDWRNSGMLRAR